ncbi:MAG: PE-PPE domain-containing protein [Candidatus Sericytochromatia bacterium]
MTVTVPDFGWVTDGYFTTTTAGQWVNPTDLAQVPVLGIADYVASGDRGALAPFLNWTAYLTNVNIIAYGNGAIAAGQGYQALIDSASGNTHEGYDPVTVGEPKTGPREIEIVGPNGEVRKVTVYYTNNPLDLPTLTYPAQTAQPGYEVVKPGGVIDATLMSLILLRNPGRPNGGLYARFAPIYEQLTGANPVTPERQDVLPEGVDPELVAKLLNGDTSGMTTADLEKLVAALEAADGKPIVLTLKADATWEYDLLSDAPATANPVSWANSVASSIFLTNLLTGIDPANPGTAPEGTVVKAYVVPTGQPDAGSIYLTYAPNQLPLLAPLRLPTQLLSLVAGQDINNPVADAIEPALKMLVDLGYTDVVRNPDGTYSRTLDQMHLYTPFGSKAPLTPQGLLYVPGDFITLLGKGIGTETGQELEQIATLLTSGISPNTPLDPNLKKLLDVPGNAITAVSTGAGNATSTVVTTAGKPVIDAVPQVAEPASQLAQGTLPPKVNQEVTQALRSLPQGNLPQPYQVQQAVQDQLSSVQEQLSSNQGPRLNVLTQNGNSATGSQSSTPARSSGTNPQRPLQNAVSDVRTTVKNAVEGVRSAVTNAGKPAAGTTSSTSSSTSSDGAPSK